MLRDRHVAASCTPRRGGETAAFVGASLRESNVVTAGRIILEEP